MQRGVKVQGLASRFYGRSSLPQCDASRTTSFVQGVFFHLVRGLHGRRSEIFGKKMQASGCNCVVCGTEDDLGNLGPCYNPNTHYNPYLIQQTRRNPLRILLRTAKSRNWHSKYFMDKRLIRFSRTLCPFETSNLYNQYLKLKTGRKAISVRKSIKQILRQFREIITVLQDLMSSQRWLW